jgi:RNA polymerase sigma factor (sigma-70 family)
VRAIKAGAEDFLIKPVAGNKLIEAIERAIAHQQASQERRDEIGALRRLVDSLTPRESEVFESVVHGKQNKQIAFELDITERTVKAHRQSVMEKLKVHSLLELVFVAERLGILSHSDHDKTLDRNAWTGT